MKLTKEAKKALLDAQLLAAIEMSNPEITEKDWIFYKKKYDAFSEILSKDKVLLKINPDTLLVVAGNILGILLILNFEKADIITSKGMQLLLKGRV